MQYKNAVKHLEREAVRSYEKTAEKIACDLLRDISPRPGYKFMKAVASVENKAITVFYGNGKESLPYVIKWNGKSESGEHIISGEDGVWAEADETGNASFNIWDFIVSIRLGYYL